MVAVIHREHPIHRAWVIFCKRCIAVPFEYAAHDRAAARSPNDLIWQAKRGLRRSWPDTEILLPSGRTFRCELKPFGWKWDEESAQADMLIKLNELGHPATWANSISMYGSQADRFGVPLRKNWPTVAKLCDEHAAAEIRKEEGKALTAKAAKVPEHETEQSPLGIVVIDGDQVIVPKVTKLRSVRRGRATAAQIGKYEIARRKSLP